MNFQSNITYLESAFSALKQQSASTSENWNDSVQRRFYEQFITSLSKEFGAYIYTLEELDKSFVKAEQAINNLNLTQ